MKLKIAGVAALFTLSACATTSGRPIDDSKVASFKKGQTTRTEVIVALGEPNSISRDLSGNTTLAYGEATAKQDPKAYIPLVGLFFIKPSMDSHACAFTFNSNDLLIAEVCNSTHS